MFACILAPPLLGRRGLPYFGVPWPPSPTVPVRLTMLGDGQPEDGGPLPPGASQDRNAFADLPSPFFHPICRRAGPDLSPPSTVSSQGVTHLGAVYPLNWSHVSSEKLDFSA